jgi:ATP-dependent Lon protease
MLPLRLPIAALTGRPIFPGIFTPIMAGNPADVKAVEESVAADGFIGFVLAERDDAPGET